MATTNKYTKAHLDTKGPGDARSTAEDIFKDEGLEGKLTDEVIMVTGVSAGIGVETVRVLAKTGATVFVAARDMKKAEKALAGFGGKIELLRLDLASLSSVRKAAAEFLKRSGGKLNILVNVTVWALPRPTPIQVGYTMTTQSSPPHTVTVNNAGVMALPNRNVTEDGFEAQFGTNHLGHFLLFQIVKPALIASSTSSFNSRVVALSSSAHRMSAIHPRLANGSRLDPFASLIHPDDYNFENTPYEEWAAYGQSKTANLYFSNAIERYYGSKGLHSVAVYPGVIATELSRHLDPSFLENVAKDPKFSLHLKSIPQGAATTLLAVIGRDYEGVGRKYLEDAGEWGLVQAESPSTEPGHAAHAFDTALEDQLWIDSCKYVGV